MTFARLISGIIAAFSFYVASIAVADTGEVGLVTVSQNGANQWHSVTTTYTYENPVVIMGPPTDNDPTPVTVRVRNVTSTGFQFQLEAWEYLPAAHGEETVSYLVMEAGSYTLANGARIEAGILEDVTSDFSFQDLTSGFSESPSLFAQVITSRKNTAVTIQLHDIRTDRFTSRLLVEEARKGIGHPAEHVAWVAIETSRLGGTNQYVAGVSDREIGSVPTPVLFGQGGFSPMSPFFCNQRSWNDADPAAMRCSTVESSSAIVYQQEEKSETNETIHEVGLLSFAVFNEAGDIPFDPHPPEAWADEVTINPFGMINLDVPANDSDPEGDLDPSTLTIGEEPEFGTLEVDTLHGRITYSNTNIPFQEDRFSYTVKDSRGESSNEATVTIAFDSSARLANTTLNLPPSIPLGAFKLEDALPGLTFNQPVNMAIPPGETQRLFVIEKRGRIWVVDDLTSPTPQKELFLDLSGEVSTFAERGLMSLAFHPNYASNGTFFVVYSDNSEPKPNPYPGKPTRHSILSRMQVSETNPNRANRSSERVLIKQIDRDSGHQGGDLEFGPDGYLYMSTGDEGSQTDSFQNTQTITKNFFSGILRIDVDKKPENLEPNPHPSVPTDGSGLAYYSVPADNPWVGASEFEGVPFGPEDVVRTEFYAVGLRNPWQMSFDPLTQELWVGDVGKGDREEIDKIVAGGNYQWAYKEGTIDGPKAPWMPEGFTGIPPVYDYPRAGSPAAVIGGVVYRGRQLPDLEGAYLFADHGLNKIWSLREKEGGEVQVDIVAYEGGVTSFLADPNDGEILISDFEGNIWRLAEDTAAAPDIPATLTQTGAFADLDTLTPNPGIYFYDPNLRFWSDHADKIRWFSLPNLEDRITWSQDDPWTFPEGMVWLKHFDLEMERGNPETKKRIETRFLVKTDDACYGLSYQWNEEETEAYLVPIEGVTIEYQVDVDGELKTQPWLFPGRADCLQCHTEPSGRALSFNTRQLNKTAAIFGQSINQLKALEDAGLFKNPIDPVHSLPRFFKLEDEAQSLDARVRSYLAVNCVSCHLPGGAGAASWDARPEVSLDETGLINGRASNYGDFPEHRLITPGDLDASILLHRVTADHGFTRMPPLATFELDEEAIQLLSDWIMSLKGYESYEEWRTEKFGSDSSPEGEKTKDADLDSFSNFAEYLTETDPVDSTDFWSFDFDIGEEGASFGFEQMANRSFQIEISEDMLNWEVWNVEGNTEDYPPENLGPKIIEGVVNIEESPRLFFRWKIQGP